MANLLGGETIVFQYTSWVSNEDKEIYSTEMSYGSVKYPGPAWFDLLADQGELSQTVFAVTSKRS